MEALAIGAQGLIAGLVMMGVAPERLAKAKAQLVAQPWHALGVGFLGLLGALAAIVAACLTVIGIPIGVLLAIALPLAGIVGVGISASVVGALLPIEALRDQPVKQVAAGALSLAVVSLVPVLGALVGLAAAFAGVGALLTSQEHRLFGRGRGPGSMGPYRTAGYPV